MPDIEQILLNATNCLAEKDYVAAIKEYEKVLSINDDNLEALKGLGLCYFDIKDNIASIKYFKHALEIAQDDATSLYYLASLSILNNDVNNAVEYANKVIDLRPDYFDAYKILFSLYMKQKKFDEILNLYNRFKDKNNDTDYDIPYIAVGTVHMLKKKYNEAIEFFRIAKKISPDKTQILNNLGICYMSIKDYDSAINVLLNSVNLDNTNALTYTNLGTVYQQNNDVQKAFDAFRNAFEIEPDNLLYLLNLANVSNILKKYDVVIDSYERMLALNPNLKEVQSSLIGAYVKNNQASKAINLIDVALKKTPRNVPLLFKKAKIYTEIADYNAASKIYEQILVFKKNSSTIYHAYGILFTKMNDFDSALLNLNKACTLEDDNAVIHKDLAVIYLMRNQIEYAKDEFEKSVRYGAEDNEVLKECGDFYYHIGDFSKADDLYRKSIALEKNPYTSLSFGINLIALNKIEEAFAVLEPLLLELPDSPEVLYNIARIMYSKNDYDKAARLSRKAYFIAPTIEIANLLGLALKGCEDFKGAANIFEKIVDKYPFNEYIYNDLIECLEKLDDKDRLINVYMKAYKNLLYDENRTVKLANLLKENNRYTEAKSILDKAGFEHPSEFLTEVLRNF